MAIRDFQPTIRQKPPPKLKERHHKIMLRCPVNKIKQCSVPSLLSREPIFDVLDPKFPVDFDGVFTVVGSFDGLICLEVNSDDLILWNPSTRIHRKLPHFGVERHCGVVYGFGYDKSSDDYKVVGVFNTDKCLPEVIVRVHSLKSDRWKTINDFKGEVLLGAGAFAHGRLHWISEFEHDGGWVEGIVYIDLETEECGVLQMLNLVDDCNYYEIGASDGCLFVLCGHAVSADLWINVDYGGSGKESWTKVVQGC